jgi:hypothetical protein
MDTLRPKRLDPQAHGTIGLQGPHLFAPCKPSERKRGFGPAN